jgi:tetratricopeptide (TPR) repeat protein
VKFAPAPFNLGNMLRSNGRRVEAEAALRAAMRADPMFAEAWYNLSDLLDEQGRSEAAMDVCARRYEPRRPTLMRYSISRFCFNEATSTRKLRNTGDNISPMMLNPNGQRGRGGP